VFKIQARYPDFRFKKFKNKISFRTNSELATLVDECSVNGAFAMVCINSRAAFLPSFVSVCLLVLLLFLVSVSTPSSVGSLHLMPDCDLYLFIRFSYWLLFICAVRSFIEFALCLRGVQ